jgi:GNAT superfamily N-acetyltransferase
LGATEAFMVHRLKSLPPGSGTADVRIQRVTTADLATRLARAARSRQILPEYLRGDAPLRAYVALKDDEPVGWVRSIVVGDATWCSNMFVVPQYRRRGIGAALLDAMLRDDRSGGANLAVLLASHTGAKLYPVVGYEQIGTLLLFAPRRTGNAESN